jgi:hypothetical protein
VHADHVGLEAESAGDVLVDVSVSVDEPRQDELIADVDDLAGVTSAEGRSHRGDPSRAHRDIERTVEVLGRVDDAATLEQEVVGSSAYGVLLGPILTPARAPQHAGVCHMTARAIPLDTEWLACST